MVAQYTLLKQKPIMEKGPRLYQVRAGICKGLNEAETIDQQSIWRNSDFRRLD